jgi:hypothetical protein
VRGAVRTRGKPVIPARRPKSSHLVHRQVGGVTHGFRWPRIGSGWCVGAEPARERQN